LGFFGLLNKDADGLQSSWYGTVTLEPINGGKEPSNLTSEYRVSLTKNDGAIFDKTPVT